MGISSAVAQTVTNALQTIVNLVPGPIQSGITGIFSFLTHPLTLVLLFIAVEIFLIYWSIKAIKAIREAQHHHEEARLELYRELDSLKLTLREARTKLEQKKASPQALNAYEIGEIVGKVLTKLIIVRKFSVPGLVFMLLPKAKRIAVTFFNP